MKITKETISKLNKLILDEADRTKTKKEIADFNKMLKAYSKRKLR